MENKSNICCAVLGAGNIGTAVIKGLAKSYPVRVFNRSEKRLAALTDIENIEYAGTDSRSAVEGATHVFVCLEGDAVQPVLSALTPVLAKSRPVIVSCAAASTLDKLQDALAPDYQSPRMVRLLPNLAAQAACSTNIMCCRGIDNEEETKQMLESALGSTYCVEERLFGPAMALSSCGIAYALHYLRAAMRAGIENGLDADTAMNLAAGAMAGAVAMLSHTGEHPEALIDRVCTPGGLTIAGLNAMDANGFTAAVINGHKAAAKR